ncbi:hypothetical protein P171DRAFT_515566 [Karstenula rhodostoma CBS 690.94]|uniref:Uncharacterized protein n=1 Tax=Karstenula rhodostoma CBS 690.94 TaxID=1392251 RepID=A0A9P4UIV8_9PLEO|nr:hypothetical protein P171DRAFT_515566 [Karstenula rhodostoma CBS 690.94]
MEHSPLVMAIANETLSNAEAILELYTRRDYYASNPSQTHHGEITRLFEAGVFDTKKAVAAREPVVKVLKKLMLDVGSLLDAGNKFKKGVSRVRNTAQSSSKVGAATGENDQHDEHESSARPVAHMSHSQQVDDTSRLRNSELLSAEDQETVSVSGYSGSSPASQEVGTAAVTTAKYTKGKRKVPEGTKPPSLKQILDNVKAQNPGWSEEKIRKTASDQFVQSLAKQRAIAKNAAVDLSSTHKAGSASTDSLEGVQQPQADTKGNDDARPLPPSRSVSPFDPLSSMGTWTSTSIAASSATGLASGFAPANAKRPPPKAPAPKRRDTPPKENKPARRKRRKFKSAEIVVDSDESDTEMKRSHINAPSELSVTEVVDPSEGLSGFENLDDNGNYKKKPHARLLLVNGKPREALVVKLKVSPEKLLDALNARKKKTERKKLELSPSTSGAHTRQSRNESKIRTSDTANADSGLSASLFALQSVPEITSDDEDAAWESDPEITTLTAPRPPPEVHFPGFPILTASQLAPFMKGLAIAMENIIADHTDNPDATLPDLVEQLKEDKPTLPSGGDERHIVMSGGEYVYAAVHQIYADAAPAKDSPKDSSVDADGDIVMAPTSPDDVEQVDHVKLTDHHDGITALPEKARYNGKGRAWKKTPGDADPAFHALSNVNVSNLPKRDISRRKATRGGRSDAWNERGIEELFGAFCAHVKREYWFQAGHVGIQPDKEVLPVWLWER